MLYSRKLKHTTIILPLLLLLLSILLLPTTTTAAISTLFAGDSDIEGWSTSSKFPNSRNTGVGGFTCKQVYRRIRRQLQRFSPERVVLVCGENDLTSKSVSKTFNDFMDVVTAIVDTGARVVYMGTKPEPDSTGLHSKYRQYDAKIRAKATEMAASQDAPPLVMVDVYPVFDTIEGNDPGALYQNDDLHLSNYGYSYWNTWATTALADESCIRWKDDQCQEDSNGPPSVIVGEAGVNVCSSGYQKIQSEQGCKAAMLFVGESTFNGDEDEGNWPSNCYSCDNVADCTDGVWFNEHETGKAVNGARPICALPGWEEQALCKNDIDWIYTGSRDIKRNCDWIGKKKLTKRCAKTGDDGRLASEACAVSCVGHGSGCQ